MTCPRCKGTVGREYDFGAAEYDYVCINCGHRQPVVPLVPLDKPKDGQTSKWDSVRHGTG